MPAVVCAAQMAHHVAANRDKTTLTIIGISRDNATFFKYTSSLHSSGFLLNTDD
jgi:hypothetical protein